MNLHYKSTAFILIALCCWWMFWLWFFWIL